MPQHPSVGIEYGSISHQFKVGKKAEVKSKQQAMEKMTSVLNEFGAAAWQVVKIDWTFDGDRFSFDALLARGWTANPPR